MYTILIVVLVIIYVAIAIYTYGLSFSYWQNIFPNIAAEQYYGDMLFSILSGIIWPIVLLVCLLNGVNIIEELKRKPKYR